VGSFEDFDQERWDETPKLMGQMSQQLHGYCKICPESTGIRLCSRVYMSYCVSMDVNRRKLLYTPVWTMHIV